MTEAKAAEFRVALAVLSEGIAMAEEVLEDLAQQCEELRRDDPAAASEYTPEALEATIAQARIEVEQGRALQAAIEQLLASGWGYKPALSS